MDYSDGKISIQRDGADYYKVSMGPRVLGYINISHGTFNCKREKYKCEAENCKECKYYGQCHYFRLYNGYGFNAELLKKLRAYQVKRINILLRDFTAGWYEGKVLTIDDTHWWYNTDEIDKRTLRENAFEGQVVIREEEFQK